MELEFGACPARVPSDETTPQCVLLAEKSMPIPLPCPACKETSEFDESYRGCLRPCPRCGAKVQVPEDVRLIPQPVPVEAACFCGMEQVDAASGLWFVVTYVDRYQHKDPKQKRSGLWDLLMGIQFLFLPQIAGNMVRTESSVENRLRWACPACQGQVARARVWAWLGAILCLVAIAGPPWVVVCIAWDNVSWADSLFDWFLLAAASPFVAFGVYRLGFRVVAWGFARACGRFVRIRAYPDLRSPVLLHPDGRYVGAGGVEAGRAQ